MDVAMPTRKRPGRPRINPREQSTERNIRLAISMDDEVCRLALQRQMSVAEVIRRAIRRYLEIQETTTPLH